MIVDPNTGQPVFPDTMGGTVGMTAMSATGTNTPLLESLMMSLPGVKETMGWNIRRTSNTMLRGGRRSGLAAGRGFRQTFSPLAFNRLGDAANIEPLPGSHTYSPFNVLANYSNKGLARVARKHPEGIARAFGAPGADGTWFSPGTLGRLGSMSSIYGASEKKLARMAPNIENAFKTINPSAYYGSKVGGIRAFPALQNGINLAGKNELGQMAGLSMRGSVSQKIAGYVHASAMNKIGIGADEAVSLISKTSAFSEGVSRQAAHLASSNKALQFTARNSRFLGAASKAAGTVGTVLLVHDLAVMAGKTLGSATRTVIDGANSIKGSIDKPIMGMGFKDNSIAATSRQRGVMAIQNSRLNMRSVLGNEAAGIHAAWG